MYKRMADWKLAAFLHNPPENLLNLTPRGRGADGNMEASVTVKA